MAVQSGCRVPCPRLRGHAGVCWRRQIYAHATTATDLVAAPCWGRESPVQVGKSYQHEPWGQRCAAVPTAHRTIGVALPSVGSRRRLFAPATPWLDRLFSTSVLESTRQDCRRSPAEHLNRLAACFHFLTKPFTTYELLVIETSVIGMDSSECATSSKTLESFNVRWLMPQSFKNAKHATS